MEEKYILRGPDSATDIPEFQKHVSVIEILFQAMKNNGNNIAQQEVDSGKSITFSELLKQSSIIASNLQKIGITEGDIVVICLDKSILAYSILAAIIFTGATVALWGTHFSKDELQHQTERCSPKVIFCTKETHKKMKLTGDAHKIVFFFPDGTSPHSEHNFLLKDDSEFKIYQVKEINNHYPLIMFTSGSTGPCKPVLIPNVSLQRYGHRYCNINTKRFLVVSPFYWIGSIVTYVSSIIKNYAMVLTVCEPALQLHRSQQYEIDTWMITPPMMLSMINIPNLMNYEQSLLHTIIIGGSTLSPLLKKTFVEKIGLNNVNLNHLLGSTEAGIFTTFEGLEPKVHKNTSSCGKLTSGAQLKVVDEKGVNLGPGKVGELRIKTDSMMARYFQCPEETAQAFDSEGWFCTGDAGYYDEEGYIYATGRLSELIHYRDNKLSMTSVEGLLISHPAVHEAVVIAKPHPIDNEHATAFVVIKPNIGVTAEEIQTFIDDQVGDIYKLRGGVHFIDTIPKLPNGKIMRNILRKEVLKLK